MTEWMPIGEAAKAIGDDADERTARRKLLKLISSGLVNARSFKSKEQFSTFHKADNLCVFSEVVRREYLDDCQFPFPAKYRGGEVGERKLLESTSLLWLHAEAEPDWRTQKRNDLTVQQVRSDWNLGHFQHRLLSYSDGWLGEDEDDGFYLREEDYYSVEVEEEGIKRFFGLSRNEESTDSPNVRGRSTTYNWEVAFADVAAMLFLDLDFPDLNARGVQRDIVAALRSSFEERGLNIPSDETLKPKARLIVGALRSRTGK